MGTTTKGKEPSLVQLLGLDDFCEVVELLKKLQAKGKDPKEILRAKLSK